MFPVLEAVKALGESARNDEMQKAVVRALALTEQQQLMHTGSRLAEIEFRAHWAKTSSSRDWRAREQQTRVC